MFKYTVLTEAFLSAVIYGVERYYLDSDEHNYYTGLLDGAYYTLTGALK